MPRQKKNITKPVEKVEEKKVAEASVAEETVVEEAPVVAEAPVEKPAAPINMVVEQKAPPVKILYVDSCISNNQVAIGNGRYITGSGRIFAVPLDQFEGEFMTPLAMKLLENRKFVVLSGLTDEQRMQYGCYYGEHEVIRNEGVFDSLITAPIDMAVEVFTELCAEHKKLVATRFMTAYFEKHDNRITRDRIEALNKASKSEDAEGMFTPILKEMNDKAV